MINLTSSELINMIRHKKWQRLIEGNFVLFQKPDKSAYGYCPKHAAQLTCKFNTINLSLEDAYNKAIDMIMADPRYRICDIELCTEESYSLRCWKATEGEPMSFEGVTGGHVLFYSEILFKWKGAIPGKV